MNAEKHKGLHRLNVESLDKEQLYLPFCDFNTEGNKEQYLDKMESPLELVSNKFALK